MGQHAVVFAYVSAGVAAAMALAVAWYERRSVAHWSFVVGMLVLAVESVFAGLISSNAGNDAVMVHWQKWRLLTLSFFPGVWLFFSLSYARGNYKEFLAKWRNVLVAAFVVPPILTFVFRHDLIVGWGWVQLPKEVELYVFQLGVSGMILYFAALMSSVLVMMNLERTFRTSVGTMRWRIKFMVLGLGLLFAVRAYTCSQALLFHKLYLSMQWVNAAALLGGCLLMLRSLLRAGHFDVTVYPSQQVLQNSLTALLAGIYLVIVGVFAEVVKRFLADKASGFTLQAFIVLVSLVLLTILLLSERVRLQLRRFVSRHFQRPLYDYRTVWRSITQGTASRMDQVELCRAAVTLVADIFQVLSVTIWVVDDKREKLQFASSTMLSETKGIDIGLSRSEVVELLLAMQANPEPVDIDQSKATWAVALRKCHPEQFQQGGSRICVPMMGAGEVVGMMTMGDRVGGVMFSLQDFDLLKCVGDQVAAGLLNTQLSKKLLEAKEVEAFQTMSAFFVHDLKNTASTLNLMLKNLPVHFNDPAFRADALRGIGKTVDHINNLIERLGSLRHGLTIQRGNYDLNEVVTKSVADWKDAMGVALIKELNPLPKVALDQEQMLKVIVNLVLNAREAVSSSSGQVRIATTQNNGWAQLTVVDNGCGMSPEFMNRSLFRPFQTTKKRGLGIGMFQSKMIVEAHGGRMEVESEQGKGTTFRVLLPLETQTK